MAHSSSTSGSTFSLISLTMTRMRSEASLVRVRVVGVELEDVADLGPAELLVELGHHGPGADLVEVVVGGEAGDGLAVLRAGDVDGDVVAVLGGPVDRGQLGEVLTQAVDLGVDLLVGDDGATGW